MWYRQFWEISDEVLNRIEDPVNYLENKLKHNAYLKSPKAQKDINEG